MSELNYLNLLENVLTHGEERKDRTNVGTISLFAPPQLRFNMEDGFPLLTSKKMGWKSILSELIWFIEGSDDERRLCEILHGTRSTNFNTIWTENAKAPYWNGKHNGDLGRIYGVQWRKWNSVKQKVIYGDDNEILTIENKIIPLDQLSLVINQIKNDPTNRRIILTAWNPGEFDQMALPPCHAFCQFYVSSNDRLSLQMYQRSADMFLGVPFNIASYAALLSMVAHVTNKKPHELIMVFGDAHIYKNHISQVEHQLSRRYNLYEFPTLEINNTIESIDDFGMDDLQIVGYVSHPSIRASMAV